MLASTIDLEKCYLVLGISRDASLNDLKTAYRLLARKFHPDLNPGDVDAHQRFISLNQAYQILLDKFASRSIRSMPTQIAVPKTPEVTITVTRKSPSATTSSPQLSKEETELKCRSFERVESLLKQQQFLQAIGLIEGLKQRLPPDLQIDRLQGIIYARFGNRLIDLREFDKARIYLKKALKADPHNRQLWQDVNRSFDRITRAI